MTKAPAARKSRYTDEEREAFKAQRAALVEGVKTFEPEGDRQENAFERLSERYSVRNSMLIIMQKPITAGYVQAMSKWNDEGRKIRKGAKAIYILAPAGEGRKADVEIDETTGRDPQNLKTERKRFVWVRVFDKIDTEPLPADWNDRKPSTSRPARPARKVATPALDEFLK